MAKAKKVKEKVTQGPVVEPNKFKLEAKSDEQQYLLDILNDDETEIIILTGPAGSGKSLMTTLFALNCLFAHKIDRIVLTRPAIPAGENLGFLPGDQNAKISPFLAPVLNIMGERMTLQVIETFVKEGSISLMPIGMCRGLTWHNSVVLCEEAQNATIAQIRLVMTRIGRHTKMILSGDTDQSDLYDTRNGLSDAVKRFGNLRGVKVVNFTEKSIIRNPLIAEIERRYKADEQKLNF